MLVVEKTSTLTRDEVIQHWLDLRSIDNFEAIASRSPEEFFGKQIALEEESLTINRKLYLENKPLIDIAIHFDKPEEYFNLQEFKVALLKKKLNALFA